MIFLGLTGKITASGLIVVTNGTGFLILKVNQLKVRGGADEKGLAYTRDRS